MSSILSARTTVTLHADSDYATLIEAMPPGALLTLQGVSWDEYEDLLRQFNERPGIRLTYDHGRLEIMTLTREHEGLAGLFPPFMLVLAEECGLNYFSLKSITLRKRKKLRGLEPDDCFYFRNFAKISGKKTLDLSVDPPPELAIEIDVTSGSMSKFHIFAAIGVPELWRHDGKRVHFYRLAEEQYAEIMRSELFPFLSADDVSQFIRKGEAEGGIPMVKQLRKWIRAHQGRTQSGRKRRV
jgi:Uma2 family endonuclease